MKLEFKKAKQCRYQHKKAIDLLDQMQIEHMYGNKTTLTDEQKKAERQELEYLVAQAHLGNPMPRKQLDAFLAQKGHSVNAFNKGFKSGGNFGRMQIR